MSNKSNDLGKILKQQRILIPLTLKELANISGVSDSHLVHKSKIRARGV